MGKNGELDEMNLGPNQMAALGRFMRGAELLQEFTPQAVEGLLSHDGISSSGLRDAFIEAQTQKTLPAPPPEREGVVFSNLKACAPDGTLVRGVVDGVRPVGAYEDVKRTFGDFTISPEFRKAHDGAPDWDALARGVEHKLDQPQGSINAGGATVRNAPECKPPGP